MSGTRAAATDPCYTPGLRSLEEAQQFLLERARPLAGHQEVATEAALGRVLAEPVRSAINVPDYDNSYMDGYAVRSADADREGPVVLRVTQRVAAGSTGSELAAGEAARIFTGAPLPPGADAVVMQEHCRVDGVQLRFDGPVRAGCNVRPRANDIAAGAEVLAAGTRLRAQELGLAASVGRAQLSVAPRLRVAILSSGDELVAPGNPLGPGQIYNSNRYTLHGLLARLPCEVYDVGLVADDLAATEAALREAADHADLIVSSGGVSVGEEDHVKNALARLGELSLWKVAVKPGKPLAYGRIGEADFVGLPGNPVSVFVTFLLFVRPFILRRAGVARVLPGALRVPAAFAWNRPWDRREFLRARVEVGDSGELAAVLYPKQGSDVLSSAVWAHGLVDIAAGQTVAPGDLVAYLPFDELTA